MAFRSFISLVFVLLFATTAVADRRVALVIGNADYEHASTLANPLADARAIAGRLGELEFDVTLIENLTSGDARRVLGRFSTKATEADIALVYYAGHGIELSGENYLIPTDARLETEAEAEFEAVPLRDVMRAVKDSAKLSVIMLDACRDNPFAGTIKRRNGSRSLGRGFALVDVSQKGLLVSFAAEAGKTADDGAGKHSPYTQAVLDVLEEPGVEINRVFRKVRAKVRNATGGKQVPIERAQLPDEDIFLVVAAVAPEIPMLAPRIVPRNTMLSYREVLSVVASRPDRTTTVFPARRPSAPRRDAPADLDRGTYRPTQQLAAVAPPPRQPSEEQVLEPAAAPAEPTEADRLRAAISENTPRAWSLFIDRHGTGATSGREAVAALNRLGVRGDRQYDKGEVFEDIVAPDRATRKLIQAGLNARGIDVGAPDGAFGPRTRAGIKAFQNRQGTEETGYIDAMLLAVLEIQWDIPTPESWVSAYKAKAHDFDALRVLGEDPVLVDLLECQDWYDSVYAWDSSSYYIAVLERLATTQANRSANKCGAHLATISDERENTFIYEMLVNDQRYFEKWIDRSSGYTGKNGPYFGFEQPFGSDEPSGGWAWLNGEPITFTNWKRGQPNENKAGHDSAHFFADRRGSGDISGLRADQWNDNGGGWAHAHIVELAIPD